MKDHHYQAILHVGLMTLKNNKMEYYHELICACTKGDYDKCESLIKKGALLDPNNANKSPLIYACREKKHKNCKIIIRT
jgi:hypothetical protein